MYVYLLADWFRYAQRQHRPGSFDPRHISFVILIFNKQHIGKGMNISKMYFTTYLMDVKIL